MLIEDLLYITVSNVYKRLMHFDILLFHHDLYQITLQRETLNKIEAARQKEKDAKNELHEICLGLQTEVWK